MQRCRCCGWLQRPGSAPTEPTAAGAPTAADRSSTTPPSTTPIDPTALVSIPAPSTSFKPATASGYAPRSPRFHSHYPHAIRPIRDDVIDGSPSNRLLRTIANPLTAPGPPHPPLARTYVTRFSSLRPSTTVCSSRSCSAAECSATTSAASASLCETQLPVGGGYSGAALPFGLGLPRHGALHRLGQRDVLDLDAVILHTRSDGRVVDYQLEAMVSRSRFDSRSSSSPLPIERSEACATCRMAAL